MSLDRAAAGLTYPATFAHTNGNGTVELHVAALRELEGAELGG